MIFGKRFSARYLVQGMRCAHCAAKTEKALSALPGVTKVQIQLDQGIATIVSTKEVPEEDVRRAIEEAGFAFVGKAQ